MIGRRALPLLGLAAALPARAAVPRIVSVGGAVTEIVFALGAGAGVVAVDSTSRFPVAVQSLPQIGYMRSLAPEGLISLSPDILLISGEAGPPQAIEVLKASGTNLAIIPDAPGGPALAAKIAAIATALRLDGKLLSDAVMADWNALDAPISALPPVRALFLFSAARGSALVSGRNTHADAMLRAAGAINVIDSFAGYRPLSAESAAQLAPEVIVVMDHSVAEAGGIDQLFAIPALAVTPAAATKRVAAAEGNFLLGFGPRAPQARRHLALQLHPRATLPALPARPWL